MMKTPVDRLHDSLAKLVAAAKRAKREAADTTLIAVSKTHLAEAIQPVLMAGQRHFGENRVQEAQAKWPALKQHYPDVMLHLIGSLQSNKAAEAVAMFDMIHTLDRPSLAEALAKAMQAQGKSVPCFIQVNTGDEAQKGGVALAALPACLTHAQNLALPVIGLMCVPPVDENPAPHFALLAKLARRHNLKELSMGMSSDAETAVALGATYVRVGSAIFGARG